MKNTYFVSALLFASLSLVACGGSGSNDPIRLDQIEGESTYNFSSFFCTKGDIDARQDFIGPLNEMGRKLGVRYVFRSTPTGVQAEHSHSGLVNPDCRIIKDIEIDRREDLGPDVYDFEETRQRCTEACTPNECEEYNYGGTETWIIKAGTAELDLIATSEDSFGFDFQCTDPEGRLATKFTK